MGYRIGLFLIGWVGAWGQEDGNLRHLPAWMKIGGEVRERAESTANRGFAAGAEDSYYLQRLRFNTILSPRNWFQVNVQVQDSRAFAMGKPEEAEAVSNGIDVLHAYADIGRKEGVWQLRVGRQPLEFGAGRLIGSDYDWDNVTRSFDAAKASVRVGPGLVHFFGGGMVEPQHGRLDRYFGPQRLAGAYGEFGAAEKGYQIEPFLLWKSRPVFEEAGGDPMPLQLWMGGFHVSGDLPRRFDYDLEMALEGGRAGHLPARSWAGSWELGYKFAEDDRAPRSALSYKYASGSTKPDTWSTFDDLYPAGYNSCGLIDPFAWRNLKDLGVAMEWPLANQWQFGLEHHSYWLATKNDGLYLDSGSAWISNPSARSARVGQQVNLLVTYQPWQRMGFGAGYSHLLAGPYLAESGYPVRPSTFFVSWKLTL